MSDSQPRPHAWFAVADTQRCRLLECDVTRAGTHRVREVWTYANPWPRPEPGRPAALGGMTGDGPATPQQQIGERVRRFAAELLERLGTECRQRQVEHLTLIVPPRLVTELRTLCNGHGRTEPAPAPMSAPTPASAPAPASVPIRIREGDLMHYSPAALAVHPVVRNLVDRDEPPR